MISRVTQGAIPGALLVFLLLSGAHAAEKLNLRTLCPVNGSNGQTILLIDTTDPLTPVAQEQLKQLLKGFGDSDNKFYLKPGDELIVYYLMPQIKAMGKPVRVCNPGNPEDINILIGSLIDAKKRWKAFEQRRRAAFRRSVGQTTGDRSPLLESMAVIVTRHISRLGASKPTRILLFSDMLQHSNLLSHYKTLPTMKEFKEMVGYAAMDSDLDGTDVWLFYVRRTNHEGIQTPQHYYWWTRAIAHFGGRLMGQIPL